MKIREKVYNYKTKNEEGFTVEELISIVSEVKEKYPDFNQDKYDDAMMGITCNTINGESVIFHSDIVTSLLCGIQHRDMYGYEFD